MKILVICRPRAGVDARTQIAALVAKEMEALARLRAAGILSEAYSPGGPGAVLFFDGDRGETEEALRQLPLVREGLIDTELIELHPFAGPSSRAG